MRFFKNMRLRLRTKFSLLLFGVSLIPLLLVTIIIIGHLQDIQRRAAIAYAELAGTNAASQVSDFTSQQFSILNDIGRIYATTDIDKAASSESSSRLIERFLFGNANFTDLELLDASGKEIVREDKQQVFMAGDLGNRASSTEFASIRSNGYYLGNLSLQDGRPKFTIGEAIYDLNNTFIGAVIAVVDARVMDTVVRANLSPDNPGRIYIIDNNKNIVFDPDLSRVLAGSQASYLPGAVFQPSAAQVAASHEYVNEKGTDVIGVVEPVTITLPFISSTELPTNWLVVAEQDSAFVLAPVMQISEFLLSIMLLAFIAVALLGLLSIRTVTRPLERLHAVALEFGRGNLAPRVQVRSKDEIGDLAQGFNSMADQINISLRALKRDREETASIIANMTDGLIEHTADQRILLINPLAATLLGVNAELVTHTSSQPADMPGDPYGNLGKLFSLAYAPVPDSSDEGKRESGLREANLLSAAFDVVKPRESHLVVHSLSYKGLNEQNEEETRYLKIIRDVTHEQRISKMKSEFISIAAHQLRTPLTRIKWMIESIASEDLGKITPDIRSLLERGRDTTDFMVALVSDLLKVTEIEEGQFGNTFEKTDVGLLLENAVRDSSNQAGAKKLALVYKPPATPLPLLDADRRGIDIVIFNLISNALNYTPAGGTVEIRASFNEKTQSIEIAVQDTGVGIPVKDKQYIFEKFYRGTNATQMHTDGSGIGLFISKNIIERHGGTIAFQSTERVGTTFTVSLPVKPRIASREDAN